jgi:hypothetical protein
MSIIAPEVHTALRQQVTARVFPEILPYPAGNGVLFTLQIISRLDEAGVSGAKLKARAAQFRTELEADLVAHYATLDDATIQSYVDRVIPELQFLANHANSLLETLPAAGSLDDARALTDLHNAWEPYQSLRDIYLREMELVGDRFDAPSAPYVALTVDVIVRLTKWCEDRGMTFRV